MTAPFNVQLPPRAAVAGAIAGEGGMLWPRTWTEARARRIAARRRMREGAMALVLVVAIVTDACVLDGVSGWMLVCMQRINL